MRAIVDTHTLIWSVDDPLRLSATSNSFISDPSNELLLSAATVWELAIKVGLGKLRLSLPFRTWIETAVKQLNLGLLPITIPDAERVLGLPTHHKDPFDRLIIAQALVSNLAIISADEAFDAYGVTRIW